jgi:predicted RNA-binding Zn ribbon-like protein
MGGVHIVDATELALALIRTRPLGHWPEELRSWDDLEPLLDHARLARADNDTLDDVRTLRDALVIPLLSPSDTEVANALNALSIAYGVHPWLDIEHGEACHRGCDERLVTQLAAALVPGLMQARATGLLQRVGVCADAACDTAFLDQSPNTRRRYCCTRCATRARVAQHRRRQAHRS